ncbi:MAG: chalcone isomerase family protein [Planctomycetota bacterium]|nr:chalcone isomerase family protein [Planctomycetota bacterium]
MMIQALMLVLSLPIAAPGAAQKGEPAKAPTHVSEPDTKVRFATQTIAPIELDELTLAGVAVRDKRFVILVNVYAYGLYVDESEVEKRMTSFFAKPVKKLLADKNFYKNLGQEKITRSLHLSFVRDVGAKKIRGAFVDSVNPRMAKAQKEWGWKDGPAALKTFRGYFNAEIKDGQSISFTWLPGNKLVTVVAGKRMGTITSKTLCWAIWDTYFGEDPIETKGKENAVKRLAQRLAKKAKPAPKPKVQPKKDPKKG